MVLLSSRTLTQSEVSYRCPRLADYARLPTFIHLLWELPLFHRPKLAFLLLTGMTLVASACATQPDLDITIHNSERGAVYVERISDRSFQATHPMTLSTDMMARILRGVIIKESRGILGTLASDTSQTIRAFEDEDVEYLAPLLVEGLSRAASDQQVGFRFVKNSTPVQSQSIGTVFCLSDVRFPNVCESEQAQGGTSVETTGGSLYNYERLLYLTLTEYRQRGERTESIADRRLFNPTGLANRTVHFVPESARRPDSYRTARSTDTTLVIDYNLLATMPAASGMRSTAAQPPMPVKEESAQRDTDLAELRKELQEIKKKLAEQETERTRPSPSFSPKSAP
jgi:hypothetical protein